MEQVVAPEAAAGAGALATGELRTWVARLAGLGEAADDGERIVQLRLLEEVKAACAGAQARVTVAFKASQLAAQEAAGVRGGRAGPGDRGAGRARPPGVGASGFAAGRPGRGPREGDAPHPGGAGVRGHQ